MTELVSTPVGPARVLVDAAEVRREPASGAGPAPPRDPVSRRTLVLGHGAGGGVTARDLRALATALPAYGVTVVRVEQPWRVAGRRVAPRPAVLDEAWRATLLALRNERRLSEGFVVGGRSAGARVACRTGRDLGAAACLALAFPLHPPGRPGRSRLPELLGAGLPTLVVQGERDTFGTAAEFPNEVDVRQLPGADHAFAVPRSTEPGQDAVLAMLTVTVAGWLETVLR